MSERPRNISTRRPSRRAEAGRFAEGFSDFIHSTRAKVFALAALGGLAWGEDRQKSQDEIFELKLENQGLNQQVKLQKTFHGDYEKTLEKENEALYAENQALGGTMSVGTISTNSDANGIYNSSGAGPVILHKPKNARKTDFLAYPENL